MSILEMNSQNSGLPPTESAPVESPNLIGTKILKGSDTYNKLLAEFNGNFTHSKSARLNFERQWYINMAFYFGRQYVQWTTSKAGPISTLYEPPAPSWRVRLISNKIKIAVRRELSKVIQERPTGFVIPASSDEEDLAASRAGDLVFEYLWRIQSMNKVVRRAVFWELICGTAYIKDGYDVTKLASDGSVGDIVSEHRTPFHIFVADTQEEDVENQAFIIDAMAKDPGWIKTKFGVDISPKNTAGGDVLDQKFLSALGVNQINQKSKIYVKEIWIKPGMNPKWPNGLVATWTEDEILYAQDVWPFLHTEYPFTKLDHIPTGRFYSESVITDLIPLQKEYNRSRSQIIEAKNRMSKPQLVAAKGSIEPKKVTSEPGLIIEYNLGFPAPTPLPLQNLPSYVFEHITALQRDIDDISSQHEVSKGGTPAGVTAATAISFLQEEDDSVLSPTITSLEEGVEKIGKHFLQHVQQHWDAERQINIIGMNGQFESFMFTKAALNGNTDFVVQAGSATPRSRAAKQAFIMEIGKLGWIPPEHALRFLDMTETGRLYEELQIDVRQSQRENLKLSIDPPEEVASQRQQPLEPMPVTDSVTGQPTGELQPPPPDQPWVPVNSYDNDPVHLATHDTFRKSQSYEKLAPPVKYEFDLHCEYHKLRIAEKLGIYELRPFDPRLDGIAAGNAHIIGGLLGVPVDVGSGSDQQQSEPDQGSVG